MSSSVQTCALCGTANRAVARLCKRCSAPLNHASRPRCSRCSYPTEPGARFCRNCGAPLPRPCHQCGAPIRPGARFCLKCGSRAPGIEPPCPRCGTPNRRGARFCRHCRTPLAGAVKPAMPAPRFGTGLMPSNSLLNSRYVILQKIAQGGMSAIYRAIDKQTPGAIWAIKEMSETAIAPGERAETVEAFRREAIMLQALDHPNLVKVIDVFQDRSQRRWYMVMEFIEGKTLLQVMQEAPGNLVERRVINWAAQICDVLCFLHTQNPPIIYRDMKPGNVMEQTKDGVCKVIDFGIARFWKPGRTKDTLILGTPGYAPPEQYGKGQTTPASDVYALGATMHHLLTGRDPESKPFKFPPVRRLNPRVSPRTEAVILKATQLKPADRYQTISAMKAALIPASPQPARSADPLGTFIRLLFGRP
jgi:predicted amidophosphoribosyltransferase